MDVFMKIEKEVMCGCVHERTEGKKGWVCSGK